MILKQKMSTKSLYHSFLTALYCLLRIWHEKLGLFRARKWCQIVAQSWSSSGVMKSKVSNTNGFIIDHHHHHHRHHGQSIFADDVESASNYTDSASSSSDPSSTSPSISSCEMRDKAHELCRKYLSGQWNNISSDDMVFRAVSGGLSNFLYYCSLPSTHTPMTGEPSQVLLRMYGQLLDEKDTKVTDSVITMLLSERNLGPKLYGIFPDGRLEEYIPARAMTCQELKNPDYSAIIARKLATVHHLQVPIGKDESWLYETMNKWLNCMRNYQPDDNDDDVDVRNRVVSPLEKELVNIDFEAEMKILEKILAQCPSPILFCHNDLQEGNILLPSDQMVSTSTGATTTTTASAASASGAQQQQQKSSSSSSIISDNRIVFIDFEFCSYNYRGFDLGNHFCERMFDYSNPEWPHFYAYMNAYPSDDEKRRFIREYLKQSKKFKSFPEYDTEEHLLMEAEFYTLGSHFVWTLWSINNARTSKISFGYLDYGKTRWDAYQKHKQYLMQKYNLQL